MAPLVSTTFPVTAAEPTCADAGVTHSEKTNTTIMAPRQYLISRPPVVLAKSVRAAVGKRSFTFRQITCEATRRAQSSTYASVNGTPISPFFAHEVNILPTTNPNVLLLYDNRPKGNS